eukprot:gene16310-17954_t
MAGGQEPESKKPKTALRDGLLLGVGNPLLDISTSVEPAMIEKYGLKSNDAILAEEKHLPIYQELIDNFPVEYIAGGATQNSMRIAQWILQRPHTSAYFGCVGKDKYADKLREISEKAGVNVQYQVDESTPTGTCAVLITDKNRSLVANLGAANNFKKSHIEKPENVEIMNNAQYIYVGGFFLTVSPETIIILAKHAASSNKHFMMNLSAPFLCQFFKEPMMQAMPYIDVLFGNETEALTFAKEQNFQTESIEEIALKMSQLEKVNKDRSRMVVITQGATNTLVAQDGVIKNFPVIKIKEEDIVDTNGAGDAFVGGFLSQLIQEKSLECCINAGHYAANHIIQQSGVTTSGNPHLPEN